MQLRRIRQWWCWRAWARTWGSRREMRAWGRVRGGGSDVWGDGRRTPGEQTQEDGWYNEERTTVEGTIPERVIRDSGAGDVGAAGARWEIRDRGRYEGVEMPGQGTQARSGDRPSLEREGWAMEHAPWPPYLRGKEYVLPGDTVFQFEDTGKRWQHDEKRRKQIFEK